jgi:hypothetical protein
MRGQESAGGEDGVSERSKSSRNSVLKSEFDDLIAGLRISVFDDIISANLDKISAARFELGEAFFSAVY